MATSWKNQDGLVLYYGTRDTENERLAVVSNNDGVVTVIAEWDEDTLPSPTDGDRGVVIPANSNIVEAFVQCKTALGGTTPTLTVGLQKQDGTEIDNDGIVAAISAAELSVEGETHRCDGALVNDASGASVNGIGTDDGYLVATMGGTDPTGSVRLVLRYLPPVEVDSF